MQFFNFKMLSRVLDAFIDDCFLSGDEISKFQIYRSKNMRIGSSHLPLN